MRRAARLPAIAVLAACLAAGAARAQTPQGETTLENDFPNLIGGPPAGYPANQFLRTTAYGGYLTKRIKSQDGTVVAGSQNETPGDPGVILYPKSPDGAVVMREAAIGRPLHLGVAYRLGDVLPPPTLKPDGTAAPAGYWASKPAVLSTDENQPDPFYYSPNADCVFATQPGTLSITWEAADDASVQVTEVYTVLSIPAKQPRTIYWTEKSFNGPPVEIPESRVSVVKIIYNQKVPKKVADTDIYADPEDETPTPGNENAPKENRTLWYDSSSRAFRAYNREGRVFIEYLGSLKSSGSDARQYLGYDIVDVVKEVRPAAIVTSLGEQLIPPDGDTNLTPKVVAGLDGTNNPFVYVNYTLGGTKKTLYAIRTTATLIPGQDQSNEVLVYWEEEGDLSIFWPKYYAGYVQRWPDGDNAYTTYIRPSVESGITAESTKVHLDAEDSPTLVFQDDSTKQIAHLDAQGEFYTTLSESKTGNLALIRYTEGDQVWFERVKSELNTAADDGGVQTIEVGQRIEPPSGLEEVVGYIYDKKGTAPYDVDAYKDPFSEGFDVARKSAIIGVNALPGNDTLEVWWFKKSTPGVAGIEGAIWPQAVSHYKLIWPASPPKIILASGKGTGALTGGSGYSIYRQPDSAKPGYNPNEEHAILLGSAAYALRDDLNIASSSQPYVLVQSTAADGRPAVQVFQVVRETADYKFNYPATAGNPLGAPAPLLLLPPPFLNDVSANTEVISAAYPPDLPPNADVKADAAYAHYQKFTFQDRKGATWIYRGPHNDADTPSFAMRYYYPVQSGFDFPGVASPPAPGQIAPYLRPYKNPADPAQGFAGDPVNGTPLDIVFRPQWPTNAPILRLAQTLTVARSGLPAIRGQSSARILYQQSYAGTKTPSATLFDPTRAKTYALGSGALSALPTDVKTTTLRGKVYFPTLPPHLSSRFYFDRNRGANGSLVLEGQFKDETTGEKYLLLNVLSSDDVAALKALSTATGWSDAIDNLSTQLETFAPQPGVAGSFVADPTKDHRLIGPRALADITDDNTKVDSYALSGIGGGSGYIVLITGNSIVTDSTPTASPVSLQVIRVAAPLHNGELKTILSDNPLDEKLTLRQSNDFAGKPEDYEFEWRSSGIQLPVYSTGYQKLAGADNAGAIDGGWKLIRNPGPDYAGYRAPLDGSASPGATQSLPAALLVNDGQAAPADPAPPTLILRREFTGPAETDLPQRLYLGLDIGESDSAAVYLNGVQVAARNVPGADNTATIAPPSEDFPSQLPLLFSIDPEILRTGANILTVELSSSSTAPSGIAMRLDATVESDLASAVGSGWLPVPDPANPSATWIAGKAQHVIEGSSPFTLNDNFFIVRYRKKNDTTAANWSRWTDAGFAPGWVKRALGGINPFDQRTTDLYNNAVNTQVSLVSQAGKPYEGDVALNPEVIDSYGLVEIYETILRRAKTLSIEGNPPNSIGAAVSANGTGSNPLLLASGYLNDLYMILGNEAYADAENPTISFGSDGAYGSVTTSLFAFKGQLATVLDEELALLRGRDDFSSPGTRVTPVYNRLYWNYTRGIDSGEVVYAANYGITDKNNDGKIDANDAALIYPEGHGDAYGHYLTALTGFYGLLHNEHFAWIPRSEPISVAGQTVSVDYQDERKFAAAASALARTASQIVDLTYRQAYSASQTASWSNLRDGARNTATNVTRYWGVDEWAARGGQGAYMNWLAANSVLPPAADATAAPPDTVAAIQRVDRSTVADLTDIATNAQSIQRSLSNADAHLNPLGLSAGAQAFDISPSEVDAGRTHYEQIASRATTALQNAVNSFDYATTANLLLRRQSDNAAAQAQAVAGQEQAYTNQLIDIYGTPYSDDIGPGKTYAQGYAGPDLIHYAYVDLPIVFPVGSGDAAQQTYSLLVTPKFTEAALQNTDTGVTLDSGTAIDWGTPKSFTLGADGTLAKPASWTGKRSSPGRLQQAVLETYLSRQALKSALDNFSGIGDEMKKEIDSFNSAVTLHTDLRSVTQSTNAGAITASTLTLTANIAKNVAEVSSKGAEFFGSTFEASLPEVVGLSFDPSFIGRALALGSAGGISLGILAAANVLDDAAKIATYGSELNERLNELKSADLQWAADRQQLLTDLQKTLSNLLDGKDAIVAALARYQAAQASYDSLLAEGDRVQSERETFRKQAAAVVQGYRTNDYLFRAIRDEALERYRTLFDLAAKYIFLAARSYDYETGLLDAGGSARAAAFFNKIVAARSPGVVADGVPQFGGSDSGDPGLAGVLAQMNTDWSVAKTRLGFNNPDRYNTTFSLRSEKYRLLGDAAGDSKWREILQAATKTNLLDDPDVRRYCLQIGDGTAPVPGIVLEFSTAILPGQNFFGLPLAGGDHTFGPSSFATKIRASGIAFKGYPGMDSPTSTSGTLAGIGATSPSDPSASLADTSALNATPYIYLIPAGADIMSSPPIGGASTLRQWSVEDGAVPLPFNIGGTNYASDPTFVATDSLTESILNIRKHQAFRAVPDGTTFTADPGFTNARLIGRSVWNTRWKIVIPGNTLLASPTHGLEIFANTVKDIKLHLETYSYSGN